MAEIMNINPGFCGNEMCRPGGFEITERAIQFCNFGENDCLADIGCGLGATVRYLRRLYHLDICGVDKDVDTLSQAGEYSEGEQLLLADARHLPFAGGTLDGLLFECSFSKMEEPEKILTECRRVLKSDGWLIISDMYARGVPTQLSGMLGRLDSREEMLERLHVGGFEIELFQDYTRLLKALWGQIIFQVGACGLYTVLGLEPGVMRSVKCGYCLIVAKRGGKEN